MGFFDTLANQLKNQITDGIGTQIANRADEIVRDANPLQKFNINLGTGHIDSDFTIDEFRNNLTKHNEVAKADKFMVFIYFPFSSGQTGVGSGGSGPPSWSTIRELSLQCEISELPSRDVDMIEYRHYGFLRRIPHANRYGIASFTFYCTGDMHEKKFFDSWLDSMVPTNSGLVSYPINEFNQQMYECNIDINQYDPMGNIMYQAKLIDAIPTTISPLNQNWSDDSVHRLTVTFAFRKWISPGTDALIQPTTIKGLNGSILFPDQFVQTDEDGEPVQSAQSTKQSDIATVANSFN